MNARYDPERSWSPLHSCFAVLGGAVLIFILAPLLSMLLHTPTAALAEGLQDTEVRGSIWLTLWTSMLATCIAAFGAVPLAYLLARKAFPLKGLVTGLLDLPIVIPHSAAGIALLGVLSRESLAGRAGEAVGLPFIGGAPGIMAAMAFVSLPFFINTAREGFYAVPIRLEQAALSLGASPIRVFFTIALPLAWRSVIAGFILMWARGLSEFGAVVIVAYHPMITPVLIYERFGSFGLRYARPVAVLFIGVCLIFFLLMRLLAREKHHAAR